MTRSCPPAPSKPSHFGGRDSALQALYEKLRGGGSTAITAVHGLGGIGKSTLVHYAANELLERGEFCVVLTANLNQSPDVRRSLLNWWAYITNAPPPENIKDEELALHVKNGLNHLIRETCAACSPAQKVLVILDDVWENGVTAAKILQSAAPDNSTILITTRQTSVADNLFAQRQQLDKFSPEEGATVIYNYIKVGSDTARQRLSVALGGHALALKIASARVTIALNKPLADADSTLKAHAAEYQVGVEAGTPFDEIHLEQGETGDENVRVSLSHSFNALAEDDQRRFILLGVLAPDAPFEIGVLAALWKCSEERASDYANILQSAGLIDAAEAHVKAWQTAWYWMHPLLRVYARALLDHDDDKFDAYQRHFTYYQQLHASDLNINNDPARHPRISVDWENIRAALDWGLVNERIISCDFVTALFYYMIFREDIVWLRSLLASTLAAARSAKYQQATANAEMSLGEVARRMGEAGKARAYYKRALATYTALDARQGAANVEKALGEVAQLMGDIGEARGHYERALAAYMAMGARQSAAIAENALGDIARLMGDMEAARGHYERVLATCTADGERLGIASIEMALGGIAQQADDLGKARDHYERAQAVYLAVGSRLGSANVENALGDIARLMGVMGEARGYYERAQATYIAIGARFGAARVEKALGKLATSEQDFVSAITYFEKAITLYDEIGSSYDCAVTIGEMAPALIGLGQYEKALQNYLTALGFFLEKQLQLVINIITNNISEMKSHIGAEKFAEVWREVVGNQPQPDWLT